MTITAQEIVGEISKARRVYEIFAEAEKIIRFFSELEAHEKALQKDIADAEAELEATDKKIDEALESCNVKLAAATDEVEKSKKAVAANKARADKLISDATAKSELARVEYEAQVAAYKDELAKWEEKKRELIIAVNAESAKLDAVTKLVEQKKAQILSVLG